jgi:membrane-associated phospholipid phosphatase
MQRNIITAALFGAGTLGIWKILDLMGLHLIAFSTLCVLIVMCLDSFMDRKNISWFRFLPIGAGILAMAYILYYQAPGFWYKVASWQLSSGVHLWNWNEAFRQIPLNDGAIFRIWQPDWFTQYMRFVYATGFTLSLWAAIIRSFFAKDARKMVQYMISGHVLQLPIIVPFYMTVLLQEVWYVLGHPDGMARNFTPEEAALWSQNCFPSMHTSVAFAILLLALREKGRIFKWVMAAYCASIIFSTLYLEIHWVLDVFGGMALGYGTVKLADFLLTKFWKTSPAEQGIGGVPMTLPQPSVSSAEKA